MNIWQTARAIAPASTATTPRRWQQGLARLLLLGSLCFTAAGVVVAAGEPMATLAPLHPDAGTLAVDPGKDVSLDVVKQVDGRGVAGQQVDWTVSGPGKADLSPTTSMTAAQTATSDAGLASTVFHATATGNYVVTAKTQKNPGCQAPGCATWVSMRFAVNVAGAGATASSGGVTSNQVIGAVAAIATGAAVFASANHSNDHNDQAVLTRTLARAGGDNQSAAAHAPLAQPLLVIAKNNGKPTAQIGVQWSATGGAVLSSPLSFTDASGVAGVRVVSVGPGPGPVTVTARRSDAADAIATFTVNVLQPELTIVSGDDQTGVPGQLAPAPLVVQASLGPQPQANVPVSWEVTSGDAVITNVSNGGVTNGGGLSQAVVRFGSSGGPAQVTATRTDDGLSQTFSLNSTTVDSLVVSSGDNQTACPNRPLAQPLEVTATTNGRHVPDVTINWASSGASLSAPSSLTGGGGNARIRVTSVNAVYSPFPTTIGVTASRQDDPGATANFTATIPASTLQPSSGGDQSGTIGTPAASPLVIQLSDGCGHPIANQAISWTVISGSATVTPGSPTTGGNGKAQATFTYGNTPGPVRIEASAFGGEATVFFDENATTNSFTIAGGDDQSGAPGAILGQQLQVKVLPAIANVPVTFTVTQGNATVLTPSTMTDGSGIAQTKLQLGSVPGQTIKVVAQSGSQMLEFTETVTGHTVNGDLTIVSGDNQVIAPNTPSQALVVQLQSSGSPVNNETINWSTSSGTLSATSTTTSSNGQTSVTITPTGNGPITVMASFPTHNQFIGSQVSFSENTTLGTIASTNSNDQSVGQALDAACADLQGIPNRTPQQQDLLNQCLSLSQSSTVSSEATAIAINQLTPAVAETQTTTATTATTTQFSNLAGRMQALRGGAHGMSFAGLAFDNETGSLSMSDLGSAMLGADDAKKKEETSAFSRWGFFGSGQIDRQSGDTRNSTPGYDFASNGVTFGVDYRANEGLVLGGAFGYTHQTTDLVGGQGDLAMHGWSLSGYSTWYRKSDWYVDTSLTWGNNNFDAQRRIAYSLPLPDGSVATVNQVARSSSGGNTTAASATFGRDFHDKALAYGFYGKLQYDHESFDGFTEQLNQNLAGSGLGLTVSSRTTTSVASVLGAKFDYNKSTNWGVLVPHAEIEWQHEFRTDPNQFTAVFIDDPSKTPILIHGDSSDANFFKLGAGVSFVFPQGRSAFLLYDRTVDREGISEYNISLGFRMEF